MTPRKHPAKKKPKPDKDDALSVKLRRPHRRNIPKGNSPAEKTKRREQITNVLNQVKDKHVTNKHTNKKIFIVGHGIQETAEHACKGYHSTLAAMDAPKQLQKAKPVMTKKADQTKGRVRQMKIKTQTESHGKSGGSKTRVMTGKTPRGKQKLYCVTSFRDKPKKKETMTTKGGGLKTT